MDIQADPLTEKNSDRENLKLYIKPAVTELQSISQLVRNNEGNGGDGGVGFPSDTLT